MIVGAQRRVLSHEAGIPRLIPHERKVMAKPIPSTLGNAERDTTAAALQATLVDLVDLSLVAKQAHWNLVGRQFHDVHLHLDELVATARDYSDKVAERTAAIGVSPDGRAQTLTETSAVPDFSPGWVTDRDVIRSMFEAIDTVVRAIRPRLDETEKTDLVTQDLLIEVVGELEEARWMWQAQNAGYEQEPLTN
jgi:starvation-inducible DNA-binding protein